LATDLKTATTIAKDLQTAFPNDAVLSNLVAGVFAGILSDTTDDLDALQVAAEALPTGKAQTEALVAAAKAQTALNAANAATNQKSLTTALTSTLKSIAVGDKDLTIKSGGGGTSGSGQYFKANIGGENFTAKILSVTNASDSGNIVFLGVIPPKNFNFEEIEIDFLNFIGIGTYYADDTPDTDFEFVYFHDTATSNQQWDTYYGGGSGSLTITSYNSATGTAAGNFDITVVNDSDPSQNMQITGTFSLQGEDLVGY